MSADSSKKIVMIAGGGTGGHIYPAVAIGRALKKADPHIQLRFVGTAHGLESKIMQRENLALDLIQSGQLNFSGSPLKKIKTLLKIPMGILQSFLLILKYKPVYVMGVGGYASAPFVLAAALLGRKVAFWEPNAHPGMANRLLSKIVKTSYVVFEEALKYLSSTHNKVLGMPLREEIDQAAVAGFNQDVKMKAGADRLSILCFGGSQGSLFLNEQISDFILANPDLHSRIHVIHQTGRHDFETIKKKYGHLACVEIHEFIYDMPTYYKQADIAFCRGGASTIAELAAFGVVPLIVPLPAADDHQQRNAEVVVRAAAGFMFIQKQFDKAEFKKTLLMLLEQPEKRQTYSHNIRKLAPRGAARLIAEDILQQINSSN